ncbi:DUF4760 domain-containing protein [Pseudomonas stutzeri]|uniref:DUF4760 domain-containing protein n=1 Tax=Stutzerimonas stutzeri TaxID=316 RepID=UPI0015E0E6D9|nr:DUF4760 domain-containing protein [Stutzerimonas stutzeri]MCQ4280489.1 DUF4760 domain-containing protein [Stutzerimonas stutzeri]
MNNFKIGAAFTALVIGILIRSLFTGSEASLPFDIQFLDGFIALAGASLAVLAAFSFIVRKYPDTAEMLPLFSWIVWIVIVSSYLVLRYQESYQTSLSILVTGVFVGMGWWIQSITTAANARRTHTLNIIMSSRTSTEYQGQLSNSRKFYRTRSVPQELAEWRVNPDKDEYRNADIPKDIVDALDGSVYVLNYFEFLAQGIKFRDLDACLLRECFSVILGGLERRHFHMIIEAQKLDPKLFEGVVRLTKEWNGESTVEKYRGNPASAQLGTPYPDRDELHRMLTGSSPKNGPHTSSLHAVPSDTATGSVHSAPLNEQSPAS